MKNAINVNSFGTVLVTGGAGYVGSHFLHRLRREGIEYVVLDDLRRGTEGFVEPNRLIRGDFGNADTVTQVCREFQVSYVVHFAAYAYVGESVLNPALYYENNVAAMSRFIDVLCRQNVMGFIFSSSCATFGPLDRPIGEDVFQRPVNPYGRTKLVGEGILQDFAMSHGLRSTILRYFNAAGAEPDTELYEAHDPETHLIPLAIRAASGGEPLAIFGTDYPTPDGTCIRDYVHVSDLADAHLKALHRLRIGGASSAFNLGTGRGSSVREVVAAVELACDSKVATRIAPRRPGDPASLVADPRRAHGELQWSPRFGDIDAIVQTAVQGELRRKRRIS